ncbi:MAG: 16S rRNA (cytosine(1402)-N(4))-methyltransferase RsmH [Acidobacteriota bacterium]
MAAHVHRPVLLHEVVEGLALRPGGLVVDATLGLAGHAAALLDSEPTLRLLGLDVDPDAIALARSRLLRFGERARVEHASYWDLEVVLRRLGIAGVDGVLFDFGVSSLQLDDGARGFSFRHDAPLDMRFSRDGVTAAELIRDASELDLARMLRDFGEEPRARRVARAIASARRRTPIRTTNELHHVVLHALGGRRGAIDPATRTFQALRIAVNRELDGIAPAIEAAARSLLPEGRLAAIAFHSLEDRLVKQTLRRLAGRCVCPPGTMFCQCAPEDTLEILTPRPVRAGQDEVMDNPRSRSARLRLARRKRP